MIKLRVQCLPEHIGITRASIEKNFKIHSVSQSYPQKNSDFVRIYFEASPIEADSMIRLETVYDIINEEAKTTSVAVAQALLKVLNKISQAVDPTYIQVGDQS